MIFHVMMYQVIGVPLGLVALDIGSDGNLLISMPSFLRGSNTTVLTNNSTENNFTMQQNNSSIEAGNEQEEVGALNGLFAASCLILFFSLLNLILENPAKTLIRSVRTSVLMGSREMNAKDVPVPIGKIYFRINYILLHARVGRERMMIGKAHKKNKNLYDIFHTGGKGGIQQNTFITKIIIVFPPRPYN